MFAAFVISVLIKTACSVICSKSPPILHKQSTTRDRITGRVTRQTLVTISLGLKETACFSLDTGQRYGISLDEVKSVLQYKNSYKFGIPKAEVKCVCDCPGAEDFCSSQTDSCAEGGYNSRNGQCYNWFREGLSNSGCTAFLSGSAEVCCSINISPHNRTIWRAVELSNGANRAVFTVTSLNSHNTKTTEVDIEGGHPILDPFYFTVNAPAIVPTLKAGWFFGTDSGTTLYGGVEINSLSEYNLEKLGWFKYVEEKYKMDKTQVVNSFSVDVNNCDKDDLNVQFVNKYSEQSVKQSAVELSQLYKTSLSKVLRMDAERRVEVFFRQYSNIDITLTLEGDYSIQKISDISHFTDFSGAVMMDKHSNYFLNISVFEGEGSIRGNLTVINGNKGADIFKINIDKFNPKTKVFYIRLSTICEEDEEAVLCLYTESSVSKCKFVPCNREPLQTFELPDSAVDYEKGEKMSILSLSTWAKHLNPLEWFNGLTNWKEGFIMVTEILGVLTLLGLAFKLLRVVGCIGRCWGCICKKNNKGTKKEKRKITCEEKAKEETDEVESVENVLKRVRDEGGTIHYNRSYRSQSLDHPYPNSDSTGNHLHSNSSPRYIDLDHIRTLGPPTSGHPPLRQPSFFYEDTLPSNSTSLLPHSNSTDVNSQNNRRIGRFGTRHHTIQLRSASIPSGAVRSDGGPGFVPERFYDIPNRDGGEVKRDNSLVRSQFVLMR